VLAQKEHKLRRDRVASHIHWMLAKQAGFPVYELYWKYSPLRVCENSVCKLHWDFPIVTDTSLRLNCPDIIMVLKQTNDVCLINKAISGDSRIS